MLAILALLVWEYPITFAAIMVAVGIIIKSGHSVYVFLKKLDQGIEYIQHEMKFNGGATMRDAIKRLEAGHVAIQEHLTKQDCCADKLAEKKDV